MTEQPDTPKILDEISRSNAVKSGGSRSRQQKNARRRFLLVLLLFMPVLGGVLFLGYQQMQLMQRLASVSTENEQLNQALSLQSSRLQALQDQLDEPLAAVPVDDSSVRAVAAALNSELTTLRQQLAELRSEQAAQPNFAWKVMEAEYLLGIANQKLQLEADVAGAIGILREADAALIASGANNVFQVRQAVALELTQLEAIEPVDRDGLYLRIGNLVDQVDDIDLLASMRENFENRRASESQPVRVGQDSAGFVNSLFDFLGSVFVWRRWDEAPDAMLAPGQETFIKQSLRLMLEQARLALLERDPVLYRRSLADSRAWLQRYAVTDTAQGQDFIGELEQLAAEDIDPVLPTLNQSLNLIGQLTALD